MDLLIEGDPSDHSAFHHKELLLRQITKQTDQTKCKDLWKRQFQIIERLILVFPGHESIWAHKRFLFSEWVKHFPMDFSLDLQSEDVTPEFFDQLCNFMDSLHCEENEKNHPLFEPSLRRELSFVLHCKTFDLVSEFEKQSKLAVTYFHWVLNFCLSFLDPQDPHYNLLKAQYDPSIPFYTSKREIKQ